LWLSWLGDAGPASDPVRPWCNERFRRQNNIELLWTHVPAHSLSDFVANRAGFDRLWDPISLQGGQPR
jgi:hypothetical protein